MTKTAPEENATVTAVLKILTKSNLYYFPA